MAQKKRQLLGVLPAKATVAKLVTGRQSLQFSLLSKLTYSHHHPVKDTMHRKLTICNSLSRIFCILPFFVRLAQDQA